MYTLDNDRKTKIKINDSPKSETFNENEMIFTWSISAWGVCTKYGTFPLGADCKHNWLSVATGLYIKTIAFDNFPSYKTYEKWTKIKFTTENTNIKVGGNCSIKINERKNKNNE